MSYTWVRTGTRKRVPYENPEGRRVNALAALVKAGATPALYWVAKPGSLRAHHLVAFLQALPPAPVPTSSGPPSARPTSASRRSSSCTT